MVWSQELSFTHYSPEKEINPLPSADARKVYQDKLGYLWMAIYSSGVARYDGNSLQLYNKDDGLTDLGIIDIIEDRDGRIWLGSNAGLVVSAKPLPEYKHGERVKFISRFKNTSFLQTTIRENCLAVDSSGGIWVGSTNTGIIRYEIVKNEFLKTDTIRTNITKKSKNLPVRSLTVRQDGSIWISVEGGILLSLEVNSKKLNIVLNPDSDNMADINVLYEYSSGILLAGFANGRVTYLDETKKRKRFIPINHNLEQPITDIQESADSTLWITSDGAGIFSINLKQKRKHLITIKNGLLSNNVYSMMQDREGNLWIAQLGGVSKLRYNYKSFEHYTAKSYTGEKPILPAPVVNAVISRKSSLRSTEIWAGTSGGLVHILKNGRSRSFTIKNGLRSDWINGLLEDENGLLWIATSKGINCISDHGKDALPMSKEIRQINLSGKPVFITSYRKNAIYACKKLPIFIHRNQKKARESIWFPGYQNIYVLIENSWYIFDSESGLPTTFFHTVTMDSEGKLWIGTRDKGLYRSKIPLTIASLQTLQKEKVNYQLGNGTGVFGKKIITPIFEQVWSLQNGALSNQIETVLWKDNQLWIGTPDGLALISTDPLRTIKYITKSDGLLANHIGSIIYSNQTKSIWLGTNAGLVEVNSDSLNVIRTVTKEDGLIDNEIGFYGSLATDLDGTIYFGTAKGLSVYQPHLDQANLRPLIPRLSAIKFEENITGNNEITLEYAALSFANEAKVRYKTRLSGFDRSWSPETKEVRIRYTNLPAFLFPKKYTFEVLAGNDRGIWTKNPSKYSFTVKPAWWKTIWAFLIYAVFVTIGTLVIDRTQRKRIILKEQEKTKMAFLEAENNRKSLELEEARSLQLSMLPEKIPTLPDLDIAVHTKTATEVGGDYYDFKIEKNGSMNIVLGDATGHGMQAGTMVTLMKGLFTAEGDDIDIKSFFNQSNEAIKKIKLGRILMALSFLKITNNKMQFSSAGMPPIYIYREESSDIEELNKPGMPLGAMRNFPYAVHETTIKKGDTILMLTDGLPESKNEKGEMFDYSRIAELMKIAAIKSPSLIVNHFIETWENWQMSKPQEDDITLLVIKKIA